MRRGQCIGGRYVMMKRLAPLGASHIHTPGFVDAKYWEA